MKLPRFLRNLLGAIAFSLPNFARGKDEATDKETDLHAETVQTKLKPGGALEEVNKHYGTTIAGGPGSQKLGDAFDALPEATKREWIAARKGRIISGDALGAEQLELPHRLGRGSTSAIARALDRRYTRDASGRLTPRTDAAERDDHATRMRLSSLDQKATP